MEPIYRYGHSGAVLWTDHPQEILLAWDPEFWRDIDERTQRGRKNSVTLEVFRKRVTRTKPVRRRAP